MRKVIWVFIGVGFLVWVFVFGYDLAQSRQEKFYQDAYNAAYQEARKVMQNEAYQQGFNAGYTYFKENFSVVFTPEGTVVTPPSPSRLY